MNLENYKSIKSILNGAKLLIVTKKKDNEEIMKFYNLGERHFGENRSNELKDKALSLPKDIKWHFIGHLQKNKVKDVIPYIHCIESLDSLSLAKEIEKECIKHNKTIEALIEVHLATEDTKKSGLDKNEVIDFINECKYEHINIIGIMVMGPHTDNIDRIEEVFLEAHNLFKELQAYYGKEVITTLSMGMSDDYKIALKNGSTELRIGTYLFEGEN